MTLELHFFRSLQDKGTRSVYAMRLSPQPRCWTEWIADQEGQGDRSQALHCRSTHTALGGRAIAGGNRTTAMHLLMSDV
eukprot:5369299-Pyramimonas_sp.AAC.1